MIRKPICGNRRILVRNLEQLAQLAGFISKSLVEGDFVALTGELGAGKTTFTRLLCQQLGITGNITSPTFTLLNEYETPRFHLLHGDLYRLTDAEIQDSLPELEERLCEPENVLILEWADKAPELHDAWTWHLDFAFATEDETVRYVTLETSASEKLNSLPEILQDDPESFD